jgi:hypothetical protein
VFQIANRFESKFEIEENLLELFNKLKSIYNNKENYIPGVYDNEVRNLSEHASVALDEHLNNSKDLLLLYDRRYVFGLEHFDQELIDRELTNTDALTAKLVKRNDNFVSIKPNEYSFNNVISSIFRLERLPLLVIIHTSNQLDQLLTVHQGFSNVVNNEDCSVLFRMDNDSNGLSFNSYIKDNNLNNPVAENTKIVYINDNKIPKPLLKSGWLPKATLQLGSIGGYNKLTHLLNGIDLNIEYSDAPSMFKHINRRGHIRF